MYRGRIRFDTPMLWLMAFFTTFAIGGMTGVLMAIPPVDFQTHNSLFLVAHFHNVIIGGVVFGFFSGMTYWFPKVAGFMLDEKRGKVAFWLWVVGFYLKFMPYYSLGLMGVMRRNQHYMNLAYKPYFVISLIGAIFIISGFLTQIYQFIYSVRHREQLRDKTGDPWDGRTMEWSLSSPAPFYNFAHTPEVSCIDDYWYKKQEWKKTGEPAPKAYEDVHMPKNTSVGFFIAIFSGVMGFSIIWHMWLPCLFGFVGIIVTVILRTFNTDIDYYVKAEEVEKIENKHLEEKRSA